jgi:hypothetical protein
MSATLARRGGRVQLEQSDMGLALNMAKIAKGGISHAGIETTQQLIKKPRAQVQEEKKRGIEFPRYNKVKTAIERHPAMVRKNQTDRCLPSPNGTAHNPETCWRHKGKGTPRQRRAPPRPESPPVTADDDQRSEPEGMAPAYVYIQTSLPNARLLPRIACAIYIFFQIC